MKKWFSAILFAVFVMGTPVLYAKPERIVIKDASKKAGERAAASQLNNINLQDVEDPAARRAIQEILNYLGLQSRK
jgi:hypothetical protein